MSQFDTNNSVLPAWKSFLSSDPGAVHELDGAELPPALFAPLKIKDLTLKNRVVCSPMCTYTATDGYASDWHLAHLTQFAFGGVALIFTEATAVTPEGRISPWDTGIWEDGQIAQWKRVTDSLHSHGAAAAMQIAHAGRKASSVPPFFPDPRRQATKEEGGWAPVGASAVPFSEASPVPHELTIPEIKSLVTAFAHAAKRVDQAGFDVLEIHGAHGYLISSFNSPLSNKRTDEYGVDFNGRTRFLREIIEGVRAVWPQGKPLFVRLSCSDWAEGGWTSKDTVELSKVLKTLGVDVIDCSSGGQIPITGLAAFQSYQVPFADAVKNQGHVSSMAVGRIIDPEVANDIIKNGQADLVALGRELLRNPRWAIDAANALGAKVDVVRQYSWIYAPFLKTLPVVKPTEST